MASSPIEGHPGLREPRRVEQACRRCQGKKIRCDNGNPVCSPCKIQGALCEYSPARRRGKGKKQVYVNRLEQRVESLEALLKPKMLDPASPAFQRIRPGQGGFNSGVFSSTLTPETETNSQTTVPSKSTRTGERDFLQSSTGSKIAQTDPTHYNNVILQSRPPQNLINQSVTEHDFNALREAISNWRPERYNFAPKLPTSELIIMIQIYLEDFNATFPIYDSQSLMALCHRKCQVAGDLEDPAWWACINTIIAMVTQARATASAFQKVSEISWGYFKNAFSVFGEIMAMEPSLLAVQAVLLMACFLSRSSDLKTATLLTSTVMRMIQIIGLNKQSSSELGLAEAEQRRCVVWVAFLLDTTLSIKARQPLALELSEIQLKLPGNDLINNTEDHDELDVVNPRKIFVARVQLAIIYSKAHKLLRKGCFTQDECLALWMELEAWEGRVLITVQLESNAHRNITIQETSLSLLHLAYYDCMGLLYRLTNGQVVRLQVQSASSDGFPPLYFAGSPAKVAQASLRISSLMHEAVFVDIWIALPSLLSAAFSLVEHIFAEPNNNHAIDNVKLMASFVQFLESLQRQGYGIRKLSEGCAKLLRITRCLLSREPYVLHEAVHKLLCTPPHSTTNYRDFSQSLMTNLPQLDDESLVAAAFDVFGPASQQTGVDAPLLAPQHLIPSTFKFGLASIRIHD